MNATSPKRILVGAAPDSMPVLCSILQDEYESIFCESVEHARAHLQQGIALIACDTHFDDCRMFDLLRLTKENPATREIPFLCLRVVEGALDQMYQSVDVASSALGAAAFVDLFEQMVELGDEQAHGKLKALITELATQNP